MSARLRMIGLLTALAVAGVVLAAYVLVHERAPVPFQDRYDLHVRLAASDGVSPGLGQPVLVAGVQVGSITAQRLVDGNADITISVDRTELPRVYHNARATLEPITPLKDMQLNLDPGAPPADPLAPGATIGIDATQVPVPLSDLLAALDGDTRAFLSSLISSMDVGTAGRSGDLRRALAALAPTGRQLREVTSVLAQRRRALARLVHNVAGITAAASDDRRLVDVVRAGNRTLDALAEQEAPLRATLQKLPGTLTEAGRTLHSTADFAGQLKPTLQALAPAIDRLPATLTDLRRFSTTTARTLDRDITPLVGEAVVPARRLASIVPTLRRAAPALTTSAQALRYLVNVLAYNPPGDDEGFLFWLDWFAHNFNSGFSASDAHGGIGRGAVLLSCQNLSGIPGVDAFFGVVLGTTNLCPNK